MVTKKTKKKKEIGDVMVIEEVKGKWARIEAGVDSCAVEHVCPTQMSPLIPRIETMASLSGKRYSAANGSPIYNEGEKTVDFMEDCGEKQKANFQLAKVSEVLLSAD